LYLVVLKIVVSICDYEYHSPSHDFKCLEMVHNREVTRCIFHDMNYLMVITMGKTKKK
jgi:hypothetical protein